MKSLRFGFAAAFSLCIAGVAQARVCNSDPSIANMSQCIIENGKPQNPPCRMEPNCPGLQGGVDAGTDAASEAMARAIKSLFSWIGGSGTSHRPSPPVRSRTDILNDEGIAAYNAKNYALARDKFIEALRFEPNDTVIKRNLAYAWSWIGWQRAQTLNYAGAVAALHEAVSADPSLSDLRSQLENFEREYARQLDAEHLRELARAREEAEALRLRGLAERMAADLTHAGTSNLTFMTVTDPSDASVVDLRDIDNGHVTVNLAALSANPAVNREQSDMERDPAAWEQRTRERVRAAVEQNRTYTDIVLRAIREGPTSTASRFTNWVKDPTSDPALDSALLAAERRAFPQVADADPAVLRAIAQSRITKFMTHADWDGDPNRFMDPNSELLDLVFPPEEALAKTKNLLDDPSSPAWGRDLLDIYLRPAAQRSTSDKLEVEAILARMNAERSQMNSPTAYVPLTNLSPGDVVLIAPTSIQIDKLESVGEHAIQAGDYLLRAASNLANGGLGAAIATDIAPASHALAFVGTVDGRMLFLNHTPDGGSHIIDYREVLVRYGRREMFVARPEMPVDAKALWSAAQETSRYGVFGDRVLCSDRVGIALVRAGVPVGTDRIGPVDITPGDFVDHDGPVGKNFVVSRLRVTGVPLKK